MIPTLDTQIQEVLMVLTTMSRDEGYWCKEITLLRNNGERFVELYRQNGTITSITRRVLLNKEVAHFFCVSLKIYRDLWDTEEMQAAFAEALRHGDTLLIDAIMFIPHYATIPLIQEAIAFNIQTCSSILFQIHAACAGLGLCN